MTLTENVDTTRPATAVPGIMEDFSRYLESAKVPVTEKMLLDRVPSFKGISASKIGRASIRALLDEGYVKETEHPTDARCKNVFVSLKPFRRPPDPEPEVTEPEAPDVDAQMAGQVRLAKIMAQRYQRQLLFVTDIGWHYWDGKRWALDKYDKALAAARETLDATMYGALDTGSEFLREFVVMPCTGANALRGVVALLAADPDYRCAAEDLDKDPYLLNCRNGTLDLRDMTLRPHSPMNRITKVTNGAFTPTRQSKRWEDFLKEILPDADVRLFLQKVAGISLLGLSRSHILPILTGEGANGKGTTVEALMHALGDYGDTADPKLFTSSENAHPVGQMDLRGKRFVVVSESDRGAKIQEATMKRLTGGDTIKARAMRQDFVEFTPSHTIFFVTNHLPELDGGDPANFRRIKVIPFDVVVPEEKRDERLPEILQEEADGILSWAVAGYRAFQEVGTAIGAQAPEAVMLRTDQYQQDSDTFTRFMTECTEKTIPNISTKTRKLHSTYMQWFRESGETGRHLGEREFGRALDKAGFPADARGVRSGIAVKSEYND